MGDLLDAVDQPPELSHRHFGVVGSEGVAHQRGRRDHVHAVRLLLGRPLGERSTATQLPLRRWPEIEPLQQAMDLLEVGLIHRLERVGRRVAGQQTRPRIDIARRLLGLSIEGGR